MAEVALLFKISLALLGKLKIPISNPSKFVEAGSLSRFAPPSSVTLLLKKLSPSRAGTEVSFLPLIHNWSPTIPNSPSKAAKPILAFTGPVGTVLKPDILILGDLPAPTTEKPLKREILRLSRARSSYTITNVQPAA